MSRLEDLKLQLIYNYLVEDISIKNIAKRYRTDASNISSLFKHEHINKSKKIVLNDDFEKRLNQCGYEYISGYNGCESKVKVKRIECGHTFEYSYHNLITFNGVNRCGSPICSGCSKERKEENKQITRLLKEQESFILRQKKEEDKHISAIGTWLKRNTYYYKECKICGNEFTTKNLIVACCSENCRQKNKNRRSEIRLKGKVIDKDITLDKVFNANNGICYICGCKCDWDDITQRVGRDGRIVMIAGDSYPSIEHYIPIAKGGKHQWSNIRLACRRCNSLKSDSLNFV